MKVLSDFVNDADYKVSPVINGKPVVCPFYKTWRGLIARTASSVTKLNQPAYLNVDCCDDWLLFSNFKAWMVKQKWSGMQLDKDILVSGCNIYSPDTCAFVPSVINKILLESSNKRGNYPLGVHYRKKKTTMINEWKRPFIAQLKYKHLGVFDSALSAHSCWQKHKESKIRETVDLWKSSGCLSYREDVASALLNRAEILKSDREKGLETISIK